MVNLPQYGGEGIPTYKGNKNDISLNQLGGEGGGKDGTVPGGNAGIAFTPGKPVESYTGPGRYLKSE